MTVEAASIVTRRGDGGGGAPAPAADGDSAAARRPSTAALAVEMARASGPDRLDSEPDPAASRRWIYAPAEFELAVLSRIVSDGFASSRHVHYSDNYARPTGGGQFRRPIGEGERLVEVNATGRVTASIDGHPTAVGTVLGDGRRIILVRGGALLELVVECAPGVPAAIGEAPSGPDGAARRWECRLDAADDWRAVEPRPGSDTAPHLLGEPTVAVALEPAGAGLWRSPAPVLGKPVVEAAAAPRFSAGESREEALAPSAGAESISETVSIGGGRWSTSHPLAIDHLRVEGAAPSCVSVEASVRPAPRRGAFVCDDDRLNRIWATSAYTLRLCMQTLMVDGIKRDRMPWIGDQALGIVANAYAFGQGGIVRDGLVALGRARGGYVNGIADYSLWWVIAQQAYLTYFADDRHARDEAGVVHGFVQQLARDAGPDGVLRPSDRAGGFRDAGPGSVFIDWGVTTAAGRDSVAVQMLWYRALRSAESVLAVAGHEGAEAWGDLADRLRDTLAERAWDGAHGVWRQYFDTDGGDAAHANLLAALAGLVPTGHAEQVAQAIAVGDFGTPFMHAFALLARIGLGETEGVVADVASSWGRMLDAGAQTFWEEFDDGSGSPYAMYGRPFGKSLCHAWATGPAALLPQAVLGLRPLRDGWGEFEVHAALGRLGWACAVVPVAGGDIFVSADPQLVRVEFPAGCTLVTAEGRFQGPAVVEIRSDGVVDWCTSSSGVSTT